VLLNADAAPHFERIVGAVLLAHTLTACETVPDGKIVPIAARG
jgi:hypothetical protein